MVGCDGLACNGIEGLAPHHSSGAADLPPRLPATGLTADDAMVCSGAMEVTIDLMEIIRPLLPLLEELERIEAKAGGEEDVIQLEEPDEDA